MEQPTASWQDKYGSVYRVVFSLSLVLHVFTTSSGRVLLMVSSDALVRPQTYKAQEKGNLLTTFRNQRNSCTVSFFFKRIQADFFFLKHSVIFVLAHQLIPEGKILVWKNQNGIDKFEFCSSRSAGDVSGWIWMSVCTQTPTAALLSGWIRWVFNYSGFFYPLSYFNIDEFAHWTFDFASSHIYRHDIWPIGKKSRNIW